MQIPKQPAWLHFRSDHWPCRAGPEHDGTTGISIRLSYRRDCQARAGSGLARVPCGAYLSKICPSRIDRERLPCHLRQAKLSVVQLNGTGEGALHVPLIGRLSMGSGRGCKPCTLPTVKPNIRGQSDLCLPCRLRDWNVVILPDVAAGSFSRLFVQDEFQQMYVEWNWARARGENGAICRRSRALWRFAQKRLPRVVL